METNKALAGTEGRGSSWAIIFALFICPFVKARGKKTRGRLEGLRFYLLLLRKNILADVYSSCAAR